MRNLTTQLVGKVTELQVALAFIQHGYVVSQPLIDTRYDFIIDKDHKLYRIQVKTCHTSVDESCITFNTSNSHTNTKGTSNRNYKGEADYFATIYNGGCYLVPVDECGNRGKTLRIKEPKNGNVCGISFLKDYTIEKILSE